jgi:trigger factor
MRIETKDVSPQLKQVIINLEPSDYQENFKKALNKHSKEVQIKGFRKGKTPIGMVRKLYGKSILADIINEKIQKAISDYLQDGEIEVIGQPLPSENQMEFSFDPVHLESFEFSFDIAIAPQLDLEFISEQTEFTRYVEQVTEEEVNKEIDNLRLKFGRDENPEDNILEDDLVYFHVREMKDGKVKEGGHESNFPILAKTLDEKYKDLVIGAKVGDKVEFDIYQLEAGRSEEAVKKYFLQIEDAYESELPGPDFEGEIVKINRKVKAEMNEEFFVAAFNGEAKDEDTAKEMIRNWIEVYRAENSDALLFKDFEAYLQRKIDFPVPSDFVKRLVKEQNEKITDEQVNQEIEGIEENIRWQLLEEKLVKMGGIEVSGEEIVQHLRKRVVQYFSQFGYMEDMVNETLMRLVKDEAQVRQAAAELKTEKVMHFLKTRFSIHDEVVNRDRFKELVEKESEDRQKKLS